MTPCTCPDGHHPRRIVLTGGPGAGKTAVLELVRKALCRHVHVLPESAGILFRGGFPRVDDAAIRRAAQRAIFFVQRELESTVPDGPFAIVLCDRGTIDGAAYWPGPGELLSGVGTTLADELARYDVVIHLRTPPANGGYTQANPLRVETAEQAAAIDERIAQLWQEHPRRLVVEATPDFLIKARHTLELLRSELPACCRGA